MAKLSLTGQITELDWTINEMRKWYDHCVNARKIKQKEADLHNEQLLAVLETLNWFADHEQFIRSCFKYREHVVDLVRAIEEKDNATDPA